MGRDITISVKNGKIDLLNYMKGLSILTIVLMHLIQEYMKSVPSIIVMAASVGGTGVHIFFVCSGIGLYLSYMHSKTGFYAFLKKRFGRIYIPYITVVFVSFLLPWMYQGNDSLMALLSHIFLFKMFVPKYEESFGIQLWYLSTIIQLYVCFIPMCKIKEKVKDRKLFFIIFGIVSLTWWVMTWLLRIGNIRIWSSFCLQYIWEFAFGICIAEIFENRKSIQIKNITLFVVAVTGIGLQATMVFLSDTLKTFNDVPALFGYGALALLFYNFCIFRKIGEIVSRFSYELFLTHILVMTTVFYLVAPTSLRSELLTGVVAILCSIVIAWGYSKLMKYIQLILHNKYGLES